MLLLLSHFSRVRLCVTPQTAAHQAPPSLGFSRQEHWSGLPFPSPVHESESEVAQSCPTPSDPMDCSLPDSSAHGIFQVRVLEWVAIAFSGREDQQMLPINYKAKFNRDMPYNGFYNFNSKGIQGREKLRKALQMRQAKMGFLFCFVFMFFFFFKKAKGRKYRTYRVKYRGKAKGMV